MMEQLQQNFMQYLFDLLTIVAAGGWLFERNKRKQDVKILEGDAMSKMQMVYDKFVEQTSTQIQILRNRVAEVEIELTKCKKINNLK